MRHAALFALWSLAVSQAMANPGRLDPTFVPTPAPNGAVRALLSLADGSVIIGGEFTQVGAISQAYPAR